MRPVVRLDAKALGAKPISRAAAVTKARVLGDTDAPSVNVRDTADGDTPARRATSFIVTFMNDEHFWLKVGYILRVYLDSAFADEYLKQNQNGDRRSISGTQK